MTSRVIEQNWETSIRRLRLLSALFVLAALALLASAGGPVHAREPATVGAQAGSDAAGELVRIPVVELGGVFDAIHANFVERAVEQASAIDAEVVLVRLDARASAISRERAEILRRRLEQAAVPVAVWIGPGSDAAARGAGPEAVLAAAVQVAAAPGVERPAGARRPPASHATLGDFLLALDGIETEAGSIRIPSDIVEADGELPKRSPSADVRVAFVEPPFLDQVLHAVSSPSAAYLLLVVGLLLIAFEFFTGGVGVAAATGVLALVLASYGLGALPTGGWALALVVFGVVGQSIDVQAGAPRVWTGIGLACFAVGSFFLVAPPLRVPAWMAALGLLGTALFMVGALPSVVRSRYATPTIGRQGMVGELGRAVSALGPEGLVTVRDAPWRARTNRATPIAAGDEVKVVGIEGLVLEVEPLSGAARDYRDSSRESAGHPSKSPE